MIWLTCFISVDDPGYLDGLLFALQSAKDLQKLAEIIWEAVTTFGSTGVAAAADTTTKRCIEQSEIKKFHLTLLGDEVIEGECFGECVEDGQIKGPIRQEPTVEYKTCYDEQNLREASKTVKEILQYGIMLGFNVAVSSLDSWYTHATLGPDEQYDQYYYAKYTYENLNLLQPWLVQSLNTMNQNTADTINQQTDHLDTTIQISCVSGQTAMRERFDVVDAALETITKTIGSYEVKKPNRGKANKADKKKNIFLQAADESQDDMSDEEPKETIPVEIEIQKMNARMNKMDAKLEAIHDLLLKLIQTEE